MRRFIVSLLLTSLLLAVIGCGSGVPTDNSNVKEPPPPPPPGGPGAK